MPSNPFDELTEREVPRAGEPLQGDAAPQVASQAPDAEADTETGVDRREPDSSRASRSVSIIKTTEDVPAALERVKRPGPTLHDRANVDLDWLLRRAGKKK